MHLAFKVQVLQCMAAIAAGVAMMEPTASGRIRKCVAQQVLRSCVQFTSVQAALSCTEQFSAKENLLRRNPLRLHACAAPGHQPRRAAPQHLP